MSDQPLPETYEHIRAVQRLLADVIVDLIRREQGHDASKLVPPEVEAFNRFTPEIAGLTYGSEEYENIRRDALKDALDHHYAHNRHHPEHFTNGICGMTLMDLIEMICDWKAATLRHNDGDIRVSVQINQARFGYSDQLKRIFLNTVDALEEL